jgi:hypothetical protein
MYQTSSGTTYAAAPELNPDEGVGRWRNERSPTVARMMWRSWSTTSSVRSTAFACQLRNYAAAYCNLDCLLFCVNPLHYLCRYKYYYRKAGKRDRFWMALTSLAILQIPLVIAARPFVEQYRFIFLLAFGFGDCVLVAFALNWMCSEE